MYQVSNILLGRKQPRAARWITSVGSIATAVILSACAVPVTRVTYDYEAPGAVVPIAQVDYGTVRRIQVTDTRQEITGGGALVGGLIGAVVGNQVGHGFGRAAATALGTVGGAVVGNNIERRDAEANSGTRYQVTVQLDDGRIKRFDYEALNGLRVGKRVRVERGVLSII